MVKNSYSIAFLCPWVTLLLCCNCSLFITPDESFSFSRTEFDGVGMRTDGYYQWTGIEESSGKTWHAILFFYKNGVALYGGAPPDSELVAREENYKNGEYYSIVSGGKGAWGIFNINGKSIIREYWVNPTGYFRVYRYSGEVVNDTTIRFFLRERVDGSEQQQLDETYHFKQFSPKPDSVVSFIP